MSACTLATEDGHLYNIAPLDLAVLMAHQERQRVGTPGLDMEALEAMANTFRNMIRSNHGAQAALLLRDLEFLVLWESIMLADFRAIAEARLAALEGSQRKEVKAISAMHSRVQDMARRVAVLEHAAPPIAVKPIKLPTITMSARSHS